MPIIDLSNFFTSTDFTTTSKITDKSIIDKFKNVVKIGHHLNDGLFYLLIKIKHTGSGRKEYSYRVLIINISRSSGQSRITFICSYKAHLGIDDLQVTVETFRTIVKLLVPNVDITKLQLEIDKKKEVNFVQSINRNKFITNSNNLSYELLIKPLPLINPSSGGRHTRRYHKQKRTQKKRKH